MRLQRAVHKTTHEARRSLPWCQRQYALVNGVSCIYDVHEIPRLELNVHLPGGITATVSRLRELGYRVELPTEIRTHDFS